MDNNWLYLYFIIVIIILALVDSSDKMTYLIVASIIYTLIYAVIQTNTEISKNEQNKETTNKGTESNVEGMWNSLKGTENFIEEAENSSHSISTDNLDTQIEKLSREMDNYKNNTNPRIIEDSGLMFNNDNLLELSNKETTLVNGKSEKKHKNEFDIDMYDKEYSIQELYTDMGCDGDTKLANRSKYSGMQARMSQDIRTRYNSHKFRPYFEEELDDWENSEWWINEANYLDNLM